MIKAIRDKLEAEIGTLDYELRVTIPKDIKKALEYGDLRENAEYKAALERQAYVRARIGQLRERLSSLESVNLSQVPRDKAALGSRLTLLDLDTDDELTYELVFPELADLDNGLLSIASPIGRSLSGSTEGDEVTVTTPSGTKRFEVLELSTMHDRGESPR